MNYSALLRKQAAAAAAARLAKHWMAKQATPMGLAQTSAAIQHELQKQRAQENSDVRPSLERIRRGRRSSSERPLLQGLPPNPELTSLLQTPWWAPSVGGLSGALLGALATPLERAIAGEPHDFWTMMAIPGAIGAGMGGLFSAAANAPAEVSLMAGLAPYLSNPFWSAGTAGGTGALLGLLASALQGKLARQGALRAMLMPGLLSAGIGALGSLPFRFGLPVR